MRLFLVLFLCLCIATPSDAQSAIIYIQKQKKIISNTEELYLVRISTKLTMLGDIYYAIVDKKGRLASFSPKLNRYSEKLECEPYVRCVIYDLWHFSVAQQKIWDMTLPVTSENRKPFIADNFDAEHKRHKENWVNFLQDDNIKRFKSSFFKPEDIEPFGVENIYGTKMTATSPPMLHLMIIISFCGLMQIFAFYSAVYHYKQGIIFPSFMGRNLYGFWATMPVFMSIAALSVPPWHFLFILIFIACGHYIAFKLAKKAALKKISTQI